MIQPGTSKTIALFFLLLFAGVFNLAAADLYLLPEVIAVNDNPRLGSFVVDLGGKTRGGSDWANRPFPLDLDAPSIITARMIKNILIPLIPQGFVLVGNQTLFIPNSIRQETGVSEWLPVVRRKAAELSLTEGWAELNGAVSSVEVVTYVPVLKTVRSLGKGSTVRGDDVQTVYVPVQGAIEPLQFGDITDSHVASAYISSGTILEAKHIEKKQLIQAGDRIAIIIDNDPIRLELEGISYGSGSKGDDIKVKPVRSDKTLYGTIVSRREVRIDEL